MKVPFFSPTGGLVYHVRALRESRKRWEPFRASIREWLDRWKPPGAGLLLIGPSGGYTLPTEWLARFDEVVAVDFDPLARRIFERRHRECRVARWIHEDTFPVSREGIDLSPLKRRFEEYPSHAILFSNVLGQLAVSAPCEDAVERDLAHLRRSLDGRDWASYHDRLAAPRRPELALDRRHRSDLELARCAYPYGGEISSYSTSLFGQNLQCETFAWEIAPGYWHLIEGCVGSRLG